MPDSIHKRTAHRWRLTTLMLAGIFFALGSFWLLQVMRNGELGIPGSVEKTEPDYIVDKFSVVRMAPSGKPRFILSGDRLTHRPLDDSSEIEQPIVQSMSDDKPPMTINARHAHIDQGKNQVDLTGNVDIDRAASGSSKRMTLKTDALTVFPDDEKMQTDRPVVMTLGAATITGTGMRADNAAQTVHVAGRGLLVYPPKTAQ